MVDVEETDVSLNARDVLVEIWLDGGADTFGS